MRQKDATIFSRRQLLKSGLAIGGAVVGARLVAPGRAFAHCVDDVERVPTSPFILEPFRDALPIPRVLRPSDPRNWRDPVTGALLPPGGGVGQQDCDGGTHQIWPSALGMGAPVCYRIPLQVGEHRFTTSRVRPIDSLGMEVLGPDGQPGPRSLPASTIYGFGGTFPGPLIVAEYGRPALVRFENHLDENPYNLDRQDFGSPDWSFLTHLHNGHTAPESDGNPFHREFGYAPKQWVDNLYLNWPAAADPREKQSFFWFHDHRMDHTSANVYKGLVGLYTIYDPVMDGCDETRGLRLPGVKKVARDGGVTIDYDLPLVFADFRLDDGVTPHNTGDCHPHPEWWGKTFFQHLHNDGFVGDVFTVNGTAFPVLEVKRRKYRLRFLDASVSRIYEFSLMRGAAPVPTPGVAGQWQLPSAQQCMRFVQIASDGGLLPAPVVRDSFQLWPAKRREVVVDFSRYQDGSPTRKGDVIYLVNTLPMSDGRKPDGADPSYRVPVLKIVIGGNATDRSVIPPVLRELPPLPPPEVLAGLPRRTFTFSRSGGGGDMPWLINGEPFHPMRSMADVPRGAEEIWTLENGGGGWVHPVHIHQEEHQVIARRNSDREHPDDQAREDVIALGEGESVDVYRRFRTFTGNYVTHCHNLAHEDHSMMFGWTILP